MNEQLTKKEFYDALNVVETSYICGDIKKGAFDKLVEIIFYVYYGQKVINLFGKYSNKIEEKFDKIIRGNKNLWSDKNSS